MTKESVVKLFRNAQADPALREKLSAAPDLDAFVEMAKSCGYEFTVEEWQDVTRFSVEELECEVSEIPGL